MNSPTDISDVIEIPKNLEGCHPLVADALLRTLFARSFDAAN